MAKRRKTGGRIKGTPNKTTTDIAQCCRDLVDDVKYRASLKTRLDSGQLAPALESMLWHYAHGKPKEHVEHSGEIQMPSRVIFELHRA